MSDAFLSQFGDDEASTVSEFTRRIKRLIEGSFGPSWVRGEVSNFRRQSSGHLYFTLKDAGAQLPAVMFRGNAAGLEFELDNGAEVLVFGELSVYEPHGRYQLIARAVVDAGQGRLHREFERLKKRLFDEGLFDSERKKALPPAPRRVAFVTSPSGAAVQDFVRILKRRGWAGSLTVIPAKVQGVGAAKTLLEGLDLALRMGGFDVVVIGRGGGSLEDLWSFNDERLARAVAASPLPVVSAVGHEIDFSLTDFVADVRAETPSAAAELISSAYIESLDRLEYARDSLVDFAEDGLADRRRLLEQWSLRLQASSPQRSLESSQLRTDELSSRLDAAFSQQAARLRRRLNVAQIGYSGLRPDRVVSRMRQSLSDLRQRAELLLERRLTASKHELSEAASTLHSISPKATLKRGYTILSNAKGDVVHSVQDIKESDRLKATVSDGETWLRSED